MLYLTRRIGQRVVIETADGPVTVTVGRTYRDRAVLGFEGPAVVVRAEILEASGAEPVIADGGRHPSSEPAAVKE